jgi:hypothetical protein
MKTLWCVGSALAFAGVMLLARVGTAQPPPQHPVVAALDADGDGALSADEIKRAAESLKALDKDSDGKLTGDELRPRGGAGGRGPQGGAARGPAGPGGPGGRQRPEPGQVLPPPLRERLDLTAEQEKQIGELENEARGRLDKILTSEQKRTLDEIRDQDPGGPPPGGREAAGELPQQGRPKRKEGAKPGQPGAGRPAQPKGDAPAKGKDAPKGDEAKASPVGIQWFATWASGQRAAEQTGRPILLVSAAPHCSGVPGIW